jgi:disulfide oxidoreductase YuzD
MIDIFVYGAEQICPSCVSFPSSKETASWLQHALTRKYGDKVAVHYIDIFAPQGEQHTNFARRILDEDLWYPVVVIGEDVIVEGNPKLKTIYERLEMLGLGSHEATH